jgi:hypothetical protein
MTRRRGRRAPVAHVERWWCVTCRDGQERERGDLMAHLALDHKLTAPYRGARTMTMHLDMADTYVSTYDWTIKGVKLAQTITGPR